MRCTEALLSQVFRHSPMEVKYAAKDATVLPHFKSDVNAKYEQKVKLTVLGLKCKFLSCPEQKEYEAIVDTGCQHSLITEKMAAMVGMAVNKLENGVWSVEKQGDLNVLGTCEAQVSFNNGSEQFAVKFLVVPATRFDSLKCTLGVNMLKKYGGALSVADKRLLLTHPSHEDNVTNIRLHEIPCGRD